LVQICRGPAAAECSTTEAKKTLGGLLDRVERGEEITISPRGKPVALLVPSPSAIDRAKARGAAPQLSALAAEFSMRVPRCMFQLKCWKL
jgi:prevent-host-death family protein